MPTPQRNYNEELLAIQQGAGNMADFNFATQYRLNPQITSLNNSNLSRAYMGNVDTQAFLAQHPEFQSGFDAAGPNGANWLENAISQSGYINPGAVPRAGGAAGLARGAYNAANPDQVGYNDTLRTTMDRVNGQPIGMQPVTYGAVTANAPTLGRAPQTRTSTVGRSVLAPTLTADAMNYGSISPIQLEMQRQAMEEVTSGGRLSRSDTIAAQDSAREAMADRGLLRSRSGIAAEVLSTDAMRRGRLNEARNFASGVDANIYGQQQGNRQFALQAGEFLQQPEYFNATARNTIGMNNTALAGQYGLTRYGTEADLARFNATAGNDAARFNATAGNDAARFNATMGYQQGLDQWGRAMDYGNVLARQTVDPSGLGTQMAGQATDYTGAMLDYGGDLYNTNLNAIASAQNASKNNKAGLWSSVIQGVGTVASAKIYMACIPEGQTIDTPGGRVAIENLKPGNRVIGYDGAPVVVQQAHAYLEEPSARRFLAFELVNGETINLCDMHRMHGLRSSSYSVGDLLSGVRIKSITPYSGVRRSFDLLTSDTGYRIAGIPVNSMIEELAAVAAAMKD